MALAGTDLKAKLDAFAALARNPRVSYETVWEALLQLQQELGDQGLIYHARKDGNDWKQAACGHWLNLHHVSVRRDAGLASLVFINCEACRAHAFDKKWLADLRCASNFRGGT